LVLYTQQVLPRSLLLEKEEKKRKEKKV